MAKRRPKLPGFARNSRKWRITSWDIPHKAPDLVDLDDYPQVKPTLRKRKETNGEARAMGVLRR
jgi:hypothetical protein